MTRSLCPHFHRAGRIHDLLEVSLWRHAGIRIHVGKTHMWNRAGNRPAVCDRLERAAQIVNPDARLWRGSHLPTKRQGIEVFGTLLGPRFCGTIVNHTSTAQFAQVHDDGVWQCLCTMLQIEPTQTASVRDIASLGRSRVAAHWASWADCIPMTFERHRAVAERLIRELEGVPSTLCLHAAAFSGQSLDGVGWSPSWTALACGERLESRPPEEFEPGGASWRLATRSSLANRGSETRICSPGMYGTGQALLRSQGGPGAGLALTTYIPTVPRDVDGAPALSSAASAPPPPSSLDRASLPVWPPTRLT